MIRLSGKMIPSVFQGGPKLSEILLVRVAWPISPLSFFAEILSPDWVSVKVWPEF